MVRDVPVDIYGGAKAFLYWSYLGTNTVPGFDVLYINIDKIYL